MVNLISCHRTAAICHLALRHLLLVGAIVMGAAAGPCLGQNAPLDAAISAIPGNCTTVLFLNDPLPRIEAILGSPALQKALARARPQALGGAPVINLESIRDQVLAQSATIPRGAAIGIPAASWAQITNGWRVALLVSLCSSAKLAGATDELSRFQRELGVNFKQFAVPTLYVTAAFRDEETAIALLQRAEEFATSVGPLGANVETSEGFVSVSASVGAVFSPEGFTPLLEGLGLQANHPDAPIASLAAALAKLSGEVRLEQRGPVLRLSIVGKPDRVARGLAAESLGPLWKPSPGLLAFAKWDMSAFQKSWLELAEQWRGWKATTSAQKIIAEDVEDSFEIFDVTAEDFARWPRSGSAVATYDKTIDATVHWHGVPSAPPLAEFELNRFIPPKALTKIADSTRSLGDFYSDYLDEFEGRMALRSIPVGESGDLSRSVESKYYERMQALRTLANRSRELFEPGLVIVATDEGRLEEIGFRAAFSEGKAVWGSTTNRTVSEVAVIGRMKSGEAGARTFYEDLYRAGLAAFGDVESGPVVDERDVGLGVPTFVFRPVFWGMLKIDGAFIVKGDLLPHYFVVDDHLVLSSSPRLSKQVIAARAFEPPQVQYPKLNEPLVTMGVISSESYAQLINDLETALGLIRPTVGTAAGAAGGASYHQQVLAMRDAFNELSDLVRLVHDVKWFATENGERRETRMQVRFAEGGPVSAP